ncbi:SDR family oxidoreductase [Microbacterium gorillae]|uniref:SDR family oxidoreductase n=1 Tax=Microbacterium gorillae TaxID=1231063 RepID=UPI00058CFD5C|nr:NAD(P)H-binding protein [Microbacterium gorillae]
MSILITGATGTVGRHLVSALVDAGESVRALSRDPASAALPEAVEVVAGDLAAPAGLAPSIFDGVDRVFVFPAATVDHLVAGAVAVGVDRFVVMSSLAAAEEFPRDRGSASQVHHAAVEKAVTARSDNWTVLRPGTFADNLLSWAPSIAHGAPVRAPYLASAQAPIHAADVADAAAAALLSDDWTRQAIALSGPESLTRREQIAAIGAAIGAEITAEEITPEEFRTEAAAYVPEPVIAMLLDYWRDTVTEPDRVRSGVRDLTGKPGRTLAEWAAEHRSAFLPATTPAAGR